MPGLDSGTLQTSDFIANHSATLSWYSFLLFLLSVTKAHDFAILKEKTKKSNFKIEKKCIIIKLRKILLSVPNLGPKKFHFFVLSFSDSRWF